MNNNTPNKPIEDWNFKEIKAYCTSRECCDCVFATNQSPRHCILQSNTPSLWQPQVVFSKEIVEAAKHINALLPCTSDNYWIEPSDSRTIVKMPGGSIVMTISYSEPDLNPFRGMCKASLKEIISQGESKDD